MARDMQQSPAQQQSPRASAQTRAHPRTLAQVLTEAERLRDHALATLRAGGPSLGVVRAAVLRLRRLPGVVPDGAAWRTRGAAGTSAVPPRESPAREPGLLLSALHPQGTRMSGSPLASQGGQVVVGPSPASAGRTLGGAMPNAREDEEAQP